MISNTPDDDRFDSIAYTMMRYRAVKPRLAFRPGDAWKAQARARLTDLIGVDGIERVPLHPEYGPAKARPGHSRIPVTFATRPDLLAVGYLLVPDDLKGPAPAVICLPGHGRGCDDIVGIAEDGTDRDHDDGYQHDFAVQCVRKGYVTLALEMLGFGHRRDAATIKAKGSSSCQTSAGAALMLGETLLGWRVWDVLRALDLLETRPEADPKRMALMGISGGGTVALYAAALDDRAKVSVLSCSFCTFRDSIYRVPHCIDNFVPGILRDFEASDIAALIAPRYLFAESGSDDTLFPEPGAREAMASTRRHFEANGAANHADLTVFNGGHLFHGAEAFRRIGEWL
jgi:dienelactone hydrolase